MKPTDKQKKPAAQQKPRPKVEKPTVPTRFSAIVYNIGAALISIVILFVFFQHHDPDPNNPGETHFNSGYDWMFNSMLANNLKQIEEYPNKSLDEKYILKWGPGEMVYVNQIKKTVPDTAIVLLPPHEFFRQVGFVMTQTGPVLQNATQQNVTKFSMIDIPWISYFIYPRQVIYGDSVRDPLYAKANYLVSFNGWGLDRLNYQVEKPEQFMVLPIKK
jgi:hypothetical protein